MGYVDLLPPDEGIWIPSIAGSTVRGNHTYASERNGFYLKINKQVFVSFSLACTKDVAISGNIFIDGLPLLIKNNPVFRSPAALCAYTGLIFPSGCTQVSLEGISGSNQISIRFSGSNISPTTCTQAHLGSAITLRASMIYLID